MWEHLASSRNGPLSRLPRLRGGAQNNKLVAQIGLVVFIPIAALYLFIRGVLPLEYGLMKSGLSGSVSDVPVQGGLHFCMPWKNFILFPATYVTIEWSNSIKADRPPVSTRTGADPNDPDSGGQPISISCAVQFKLKPDQLKTVYLSFGSYEAAKQRYVLLAGNQVSNTAQEFTPQDFWQKREAIAKRMRYKINEVLVANGADAEAYQIMKVDFATQFENSITGVQVARQQQVVNEYSQQVQTVEQRIAVLNSHNMAAIATINANAVRKAKEMVGNATKHAFIVKQEAKAVEYAKLQHELELDPAQMTEYIKIRSLLAHSSTGKVVVNVAAPSVTSVQVTEAGNIKKNHPPA